MLDRTDFASWQQRIRLYCRGKDSERIFLFNLTRRALTENFSELSRDQHHPSGPPDFSSNPSSIQAKLSISSFSLPLRIERRQFHADERCPLNFKRRSDTLQSFMDSKAYNLGPSKEFKLNKGLRQGDPLSPFSFIIAMDALHIALMEAREKGLFESVENFTMLSSILRMAIDTNVTAPVNVSEPPTEGQPSNAQAVKAWKHLDFLCHNYVLNGLVDSLYNLYFAAIIEKSPPSWVEFKNYLKHKRKEMKVEDLVVRLRIEKDNKLAQKNTYTPDSAKDNMVEHVWSSSKFDSKAKGKGKKKNDKKGKGKAEYLAPKARIVKQKFHAYRFIVHDSKNPDIQNNTVMESRNASFFENIFPCLTKKTGSSSRLEDEVVQDNRQRDDNDLHDERQDQLEEEEVEPRISKRARTEKSFGPDFVSFMVENESSSYQEAVTSSEGHQWKEAIKSEIDFILQNHTWELVDLLLGYLGLADVILGIKIIRTQNGLVLSLAHYVDKTLNIHNAGDFALARTPIGTSLHLSKNRGLGVVQLEYSRIIGMLTYLMIGTRPDLAYAVSRLSRYTSNPNDSHWKAMTRVLHYLRYNRDYGLHYDRYPAVIEGYSDTNWISDIKDSRSTNGYVFTLGRAAISWKSSKQTIIAKSTMESEFISLDKGGEEAKWLRQFIDDIP
nr:zinc finger, CCHC-type [Tanacetum cinerariifolium]